MHEKYKFAINIAEDIIEDIEKSEGIEGSLRKYYKLNKLLENKKEVEWANRELVGYQNKKMPPYYRVFEVPTGNTLHPTENHKKVYIKDDCPFLEFMVNSEKTKTYPIVAKDALDTFFNNNVATVKPDSFYRILATVRNIVYNRTTDILIGLKFGKIESDIFEDTRMLVDKELNVICPKALQKLTETYEDLIDSESELDLQQISFACRTVLNDFADTVYPPKNEAVIGSDGKSHPVKNNNYVNRIIQFVHEQTNSKSTNDFMKSNLGYLHSFLQNVYEEASTGLHTERPKEHANRCDIYTYLLLGDVIRLSK